ncbi:hypothetical protein AB0M28_12925 [Streptomyces sp. NPDC051940]|uniref:hypothetical protein n=1 Tax=Streptomyces sp. NPDC051940 TaxID=3155675 RepID=UPI00343AE39B
MSDTKLLEALVIDAVPACAHGIASMLRTSGFLPRTVLPGDAGIDGEEPAVLSVRTENEWTWLRRARSGDRDRCIIAVLPDENCATFRRALRDGATAAIPQSAPLDDFVQVFEAAVAGKCVLPAGIAATLAEGARQGVPDGVQLNGAELLWIRALAKGTTVADLAVQSCYSQREMYRWLNKLYSRMGARDRTEAVVLAGKWGIV